jgi:hypothetical protein
MPTRARRAPLAAMLALWAFAVPAPARASFTHAMLLSGTAEQQFEEASGPAMSQSQEYVVFQGVLDGVSGIWRRNLSTDEPPQLVAPDASAPSISKEGRYVAFTTTADLEELHEGSGGKLEGEPPGDRGCPEVYVRDMELDAQEPGAYTLASALNGSREGIAFEPEGHACSSGGGAETAPSVAMSADGSEVVFTVLGESNLAGSHTPPGQVAVRDLKTETTTLVTVAVTPEGVPECQPDDVQECQPVAVAGGGAFPDVYAIGHLAPSRSTAAISANGTAVAWFGMNVASQVSAAEAAREPALDQLPGESEDEPLWRRITGGAGANTSARRLLAGAGLGFSSRNPVGESTPLEAGAFIGEQVPSGVPALSEDGETVAVLANAPPRLALESAREDLNLSEYQADAYVVHVSDDPSSPPQVTPITEIGSYFDEIQETSPVTAIAVSPSGKRVALDTARTPLESPSLAVISPPGAENLIELYEANLELGTLQRVTSSYDGGAAGGMGSISFADDQTLAFSSTATDLFFGDGVAASEVYDVHELPSNEQPVTPRTSEAPGLPLPEPEWTLSATAAPQADGSVLVYAQVPGAGELGVEELAQLPKQLAAPRRGKTAKRARKTKRAAPARVTARALTATTVTRLATRTVAQAHTGANAAGEVVLRVRVSAAYQALLRSAAGLYAIVRVTFAAPGHVALVRDIPLTLRDSERPASHPSAPAAISRRSARRSAAR